MCVCCVPCACVCFKRGKASMERHRCCRLRVFVCGDVPPGRVHLGNIFLCRNHVGPTLNVGGCAASFDVSKLRTTIWPWYDFLDGTKRPYDILKK